MGREGRARASPPDHDAVEAVRWHGAHGTPRQARILGLDSFQAVPILITRADPAMDTPAPQKSTHRFQAEVTKVLSLVIHSLYSNPEVFLRELVSNASDALDKLRFRAVTEPSLLPGGERLCVRLIPDPKARTLTISDN